MTQLIDETFLENHDLYHARYGRGAVIVAVRRHGAESPDEDRSKYDKYVAGLYNTRGPANLASAPDFEPILSIQEDSDFLRILVQFEYKNRRDPSYNPVSATIERVIPLDQITLEIVRTTEPRLPSGPVVRR